MKTNLQTIIDEQNSYLKLPHDENDPYEKACDDTTKNFIIMLETYKKKLNKRLETLKEDTTKYKDCEFNAPQFRKGMIHQLEEFLGDKENKEI